jgi:hypothetical protein
MLQRKWVVDKLKALGVHSLCHSAEAAVRFRFSNCCSLRLFSFHVAKIGVLWILFCFSFETRYLTRFLHNFHCLQTNAWEVPQNRPLSVLPPLSCVVIHNHIRLAGRLWRLKQFAWRLNFPLGIRE